MNVRQADLAGVTLCAVTSVNLAATVQALAQTMKIVRVDAALLFTDQPWDDLPKGVRRVPIARLCSLADYSRFMLRDLAGRIDTGHCLVIQWDGYPLHPENWDPNFLDYDYIGAPWPQFEDGHDVGNGGFSLRSKKLLECCLDPAFVDDGGAEDLAIARLNRHLLEDRHAIRFAPANFAARFSVERPMPNLDGASGSADLRQRTAMAKAFGFHGAFNMPTALGAAGFAQIYRSLDHRRPLKTDMAAIARQLARQRGGICPALRLIRDRFSGRLG